MCLAHGAPVQFTLRIQKAAQQSLATLTLQLHSGASLRFNAYPERSSSRDCQYCYFTLELILSTVIVHYSIAYLHPIRRSHISLQVIKPLEIQRTWRWLFGADKEIRTPRSTAWKAGGRPLTLFTRINFVLVSPSLSRFHSSARVRLGAFCGATMRVVPMIRAQPRHSIEASLLT